MKRAGAFRLLGLVLGFGVNMTVLYLTTRENQAETFALYALVASLLFLLPFSDLGLGASVINSTADFSAGKMSRAEFRHRLTRILAALTAVGFTIATITIGLSFTDRWSSIIGNVGDQRGAGLAAAATMLVFGISVPFGVGSRVLQGTGRTHEYLAISALGPIIQIAIVASIWFANAPLTYVAFAPSTAYLLIAILATVRARFVVKRLEPPDSLPQSSPTDRVWKVAVAFFTISIATACIFQSHRLLLSHVGTSAELTSYALIAQFVAPVLSVLAAMAQTLWHDYRVAAPESRAGRLRRDLLFMAAAGAGGAAIASTAAVVASKTVANDQIAMPASLLIAAASYIVVNAVHQPIGMLLTDQPGLIRQAVLAVLVIISSIPVIVVAIRWQGAAGPYAATALLMATLQTAPLAFIAFQRLSVDKRRTSSAGLPA